MLIIVAMYLAVNFFLKKYTFSVFKVSHIFYIQTQYLFDVFGSPRICSLAYLPVQHKATATASSIAG